MPIGVKLLTAGIICLQAALAILLLLGIVALVYKPARSIFRTISDVFGGSEIWIAFILAAIATGGSLYFSEILHYIPCRLCWFQRIAIYPLTVVLLVGALRRDGRAAVQYAIAMPIFAVIVSLYHIYIEYNPGAEANSCKVGVACSVKWIDALGYITIPLMVLTVALSILTLLLFAWFRPVPVWTETVLSDEEFDILTADDA